MTDVTFAQAVAIVTGLAAFLAVMGGAFKLGAVVQRVEGFEKNVVAKLEEFIAVSQDAREQWAGWRASIDGRLAQAEKDAISAREARHDLRNDVSAQLADHAMRITVLEESTRDKRP